jgi:Rps23 Pro-64 3,4-dihydroxylase Tpa1-like proline 4-hydroxylase
MRMRISGGRVIDLAAAEAQAMGKAQSGALKKLAAPPREGFRYAYDSLAALDEERVGAAAEGLLADFATFLSGPEPRGPRGLLGAIIERDVRYVEVFGSRYRAGNFLTLHNDRQDGAERLAAYVLGLTPEWRPEWGGLLLFHGPDGEVERGLIPRFNVLNLFAVPKAHSVSVVAPFAPAPRLSVAGWLRARPPGG